MNANCAKSVALAQPKENVAQFHVLAASAEFRHVVVFSSKSILALPPRFRF
jgi:hypothetical protein